MKQAFGGWLTQRGGQGIDQCDLFPDHFFLFLEIPDQVFFYRYGLHGAGVSRVSVTNDRAKIFILQGISK